MVIFNIYLYSKWYNYHLHLNILNKAYSMVTYKNINLDPYQS